MPFANLENSINMYYELSGAGPDIVLISGYKGDHSVWELIRPQLSKHFRVLTLDNLGAGQTASQERPLTIEAMADAVVRLAEYLGINTFHIIGQSMGGAIAQVMAKDHTDKIDNLILLNATTKFSKAAAIALDARLKLREENISFDTLFAAGLPWSFSSSFLESKANIETHRRRLINNYFPLSIENERRQLNALTAFDSTLWTQDISNPTVVISSEEDIVTKPYENQKLANNIKGSIFKKIPGGHASIFESPDEITQLIINRLIYKEGVM